MAYDAITPVKMGQSELATAPTLTTIRTTPTYSRDILTSMDISNNGTVSVDVEVFLVPNGDSAGDDNILVPTVEIPAKAIFQWTGSQVLEEGDTIEARASASGVCLRASGGEAI